MERKIISIEYEIPGYSQDHHGYYSDQSLLDADVIVFEPDNLASSYGKYEFSESSSVQVKRATQHWRTEINTALEYGKTIFLIFRKKQFGTVYTGQKEFKGSRTINYVADYNNYEFLPVSLPSIVSKGGSEIIFTGHPAFAPFWKEFKNYLKFESYLDGKVSIPVFITKTGERPIGCVVKVGKGNLVLLPPVVYSREKFIKKGKKEEEYLWTKEAIVFGDKLVNSLLGIDKALRAEMQKTPPPNWLDVQSYISKEESETLEKIDKTEKEIQGLIKKKSLLDEDLIHARQMKDLLFETGKPLEEAVTSALKTLGYTAENFNDGELELDQVILSPEGVRFIGECEGKDSGAVNIDKFRQLEENIQSDLQREEVEEPAIGILFGNGFRLTKPEDRSEQFTTKCLSSAKRGTILIRTSDLYPAIRYLKENADENYAKACRTAILNGKGSIVKFPPIPEK